MINRQTIQRAREIREQAALRWGGKPKDYVWSLCLSMAMRGEQVPAPEYPRQTDTLCKDIRDAENFMVGLGYRYGYRNLAQGINQAGGFLDDHRDYFIQIAKIDTGEVNIHIQSKFEEQRAA